MFELATKFSELVSQWQLFFFLISSTAVKLLQTPSNGMKIAVHKTYEVTWLRWLNLTEKESICGM